MGSKRFTGDCCRQVGFVCLDMKLDVSAISAGEQLWSVLGHIYEVAQYNFFTAKVDACLCLLQCSHSSQP